MTADMLDRRRLLHVAAALPLSALPLPSPLLAAGKVDERSHASRRLGRELPYLTYGAGMPGPGAPVVYLLHGHGGSEWAWVRAGDAIATADRLVAAGVLPPLHLVMPGVGNSWYVDSLAHGPVATAMLEEWMPAVEAALQGDPGRRALIGLSMGGYGALHLGLAEPARWRFLGALSPAIFTPEGGGFSELQLRLFDGAFGEPFDRVRYAAADPFGHIPALAAAARRPEVYLACGEDDFFGLDEGTLAFHRALALAEVPAAVAIKPGAHDWAFWRAELPLALAAFAGGLA